MLTCQASHQKNVCPVEKNININIIIISVGPYL